MILKDGSDPSETKQKEPELKHLILNHASDTCMHGVPNVHRAKSLIRRLLWLIFVLAGICVMLWQISLAVMKYCTNPTETSVLYTPATQLKFPAVTLCNLNPIRYKSLAESDHTELMEYINGHIGENTGSAIQGDTDRPDSFSNTPLDGDNQEAVQDDDFSNEQDLFMLTSELSRKEKTKLGHMLDDMLISCKFNGHKCKNGDFQGFYNFRYGNCYTFNHGGRNETLDHTSSQTGPLFGLSLELYIEQDEYIAAMADAAGIRVVIHNKTYMPFPEDDGISVAPGTKSSIGMKKLIKERAVPPWGDCQSFTSEQNIKSNAYLDELGHLNYSSHACQKTCFQRNLLSNCSCYDSKFPFDTEGDIQAFRNVTPGTYSSCHKLAAKANCTNNIVAKFESNTLGCGAECPVTCYETFFPPLISASSWPSDVLTVPYLEKLALGNADFWNRFQNLEWDQNRMTDFVNKNFLKLEVYYSDMTVESQVTSPSYLALDLISDIGGQAGLWVGVSMIALCEVFELVLDICLYGYKRCFSNPKTYVAQSPDPASLNTQINSPDHNYRAMTPIAPY